MSTTYVILVLLVTALLVGGLSFVATYFWLQAREASRMKRAQRDAETILEEARNQQVQELERVANLSRDEAKQLLLTEIEGEVREIAARKIRQIEQETKDDANRRAMQILATAVQRCAPEYVAESTVSVVPLPSDDMKGRIIGR